MRLSTKSVLGRFNISFQETEWSSQLINKEAHLLDDTSIVFELALEHSDFSIPLEDLVLHVGNFDAKLGR